MGALSHFPYLSSGDAKSPDGIWNWAKRLLDALNRWKLFDLMDLPLEDKPYYVIRINADGTAFELVKEELGLAGQVLTGLANEVIRVKPTEDGYFIDKEVLHTLIGVSLTGKAYNLMRVNSTEDGYTYDSRLKLLFSSNLAGKAGKTVIVNATEDGFTISP